MKKTAVVLMIIALFSLPAFAEEKAPYTDKIAVGVDVLKGKASMRFWQGSGFAVEGYAGISYFDETRLSLGGGVAIPLFNVSDVYGNFICGAGFGLRTDSETNYSLMEISAGVSVGVEFEVFLTPLSKNLSIASAVGMTAGMIKSDEKIFDDFESTTDFYFGLADSTSVSSLIIRYYF